MIYPNNFEQKVGFDKIRTIISGKCVSKTAKEKVNNIKFLTNRKRLNEILHYTNEMKSICMMEDNFPDSGYVDTKHFLPKLRIEGNFLEARELHILRQAIETTKKIADFFKKDEDNKYPYLSDLTSEITQLPELIKEITRVIDNNAKVKDNASKELQEIRSNIHAKSSQISKRMQSVLKQAQRDGIVDTEASVSIRDGHAVIPVISSHKRRIKGFVMGESATGQTIFIEPMEVVELNNEIRELEFAEQREIVKILLTISAILRPHSQEIAEISELLSEIDFIRAKAFYSLDIDGVMPLLSKDLRIYLRKVKHPLLMQTLKKEKREIVPLDLQLDNTSHILLISGPNAGGKSVCLKTVGLVQYMFQCGLLVPMLENSEMSLFNDIFIDIGDEQSIENDLSTYSSHLNNMKYFMRNANSNSLILIDEFGTGTEPTAGGAIAEAVLTNILEKKSFGLITTHYTNLKFFASNNKGIINGAMLFDIQQIQPLFKLEVGMPGSSFAFEIARKIGLPENVVKDAESKMGEKTVDMERSLREIARDKRYWEVKRSKIKQTDKQLDEVADRYEKELKEFKEKKAKLLSDAKDEAKKILATANRSIENTIKEIKESQADKDKTRTAREQLESIKDKLVADHNTSDDFIERKIQQIKNRQKRKEEGLNNQENLPIQATKQESQYAELQEGDKVKILGQSTVGEILKIGENNISVALGHLIVNVEPNRIERVSQQEYKQAMKDNRASVPISTGLNTKRINFKMTLDVRGYRVTEALEEVIAYIDEAIMLDIREVSILHGKGNGILKEEIRNYLKTLGIVAFRDATHDSGGAGITVCRIEMY